MVAEKNAPRILHQNATFYTATRLSMMIIVVINAEHIAENDHSGSSDQSNPAAPLACGHAMDVPDMMLNFGLIAFHASWTGGARP